MTQPATFSAKSWVLEILTKTDKPLNVQELIQGRPEYLCDSTISVAALKLYQDGILKRYASRTQSNRATFIYELSEDWMEKIPKDFPWQGSPAKSHRNQPSGVKRTRLDNGHDGESSDPVPLPAQTPPPPTRDIEYGFGAFIAVIIGDDAFRLKTTDARQLYNQLKVIFES